MSEKNVEEIPFPEEGKINDIIHEKSGQAGLVFIGFNENLLSIYGDKYFTSFPDLQDVLFINSYRGKIIK